jgi:hypothetical protein
MSSESVVVVDPREWRSLPANTQHHPLAQSVVFAIFPLLAYQVASHLSIIQCQVTISRQSHAGVYSPPWKKQDRHAPI